MRWLVGALALAALAVVAYGFWPAGAVLDGPARTPTGAAQATAAGIDAVVAQPVAFALRAEATGHLAPWRRGEVSAEAAGLVVERHVEEGDLVGGGDLLLRLDDRQARIDRAQAEAELLKAQAEHAVNARFEGGGATDTTLVAERRAELAAAEAAFAEQRITEAELAAARRRLSAAVVLSGGRREAVGAAVHGLAQAEQRLAQAELALDHTRVRAPFAGRVADLAAEAGQRVGPGEPLLTLLDDARMKVAVDVLEGDLVRLRPGADALVRVPALGEAPVRGVVHAINPAIDPETGTGRVTVALPNPGRRLVAGLFARVELETETRPDRLVVPAEAVLVRQGRDLVFVVEGGRAQWVYVTLGARSGGYVEVTDGVAPGDTVAVGGHFALAHDAPVEVAAVAPAYVR